MKLGNHNNNKNKKCEKDRYRAMGMNRKDIAVLDQINAWKT